MTALSFNPILTEELYSIHGGVNPALVIGACGIVISFIALFGPTLPVGVIGFAISVGLTVIGLLV